MMDMSILTFLLMGLGFGILHAFDPDHLAAVGGMAAGSKSNMKPWQFALHWSIGHGGILFIVAMLVFIAGMAIPEQLSHAAEQFVAFMLMGIGVWGFIKIYRANAYQQATQGAEVSPATHNGAWLVGVIHGTAGSAPLLTLIPITQIKEPTIGLVYVLLFGVGVSLAMTSVGRLLGQVVKFIQHRSDFWRNALQLVLAGFSFLFGFYLALS